MTEHSEPDNSPDEVRIGFGGRALAVKGTYTTVIVVILALAIFTGWMLWNTAMELRNGSTSEIMRTHRTEGHAEHLEILKALEASTAIQHEQKILQEEQNYMLFYATPKEKELIAGRMRLPPRLRTIVQEAERHHQNDKDSHE